MQFARTQPGRGGPARAFLLAASISSPAAAQENLPPIEVGAETQRVARESDVRTAQTGDRATGYRTDRTVSVKLSKPILQTPIAVQTVTRQTIDDQQAIGLNQAVVGNVSSVALMNMGCTLFQNLTIRGFATGTLTMSHVYRNGLLLPNVRCPSTANLQSVEVVKGPASMLYGRIEPGGLIDMIVKRPLETPYYSVQQQGGSFGVARTTVDATGPLSDDKTWLYRVNGEYYHNPSFIDFVREDKWFGSATITYHPTEQFKLNVDAEYQDTNYIDNNPNVPAIGNYAASIPISRYLGDPSITLNNPSHDMRRFVAFDWKYDLDGDWNIVNRFAYNNTRSMGTSMFLACTNQQPLPGGCPPSAGSAFGQSGVALIWGPIESRSITGNLDLNGKVQTGPFQHALMLGADHLSFASVGDLYQAAPVAQSINIFAPVYAPSSLSNFLTPNRNQGLIRKQDWQGFYGQDMISAFDDRVHLLLGGRYDFAWAVSSAQASNSSVVPNGLERASQLGVTVHDRFFSPRVGLVVQATPWLSLYGNYSQAFGVNNGVTRANTPLGSQQSIQWEGGVKAELLEKSLLATLAYFDIKKYNMAQSPPIYGFTSPLRGYVYDQLDARSQGFELDVTGKIDNNWSIIATFSHLATHVTKGTTLPASDPFDFVSQVPVTGKRLPAVPENMASLWVKYDADGPLRGLSTGAGFNWVDDSYVDPANTYRAPAYTLLRAMASYRFPVGPSFVTAQINAENLLDQAYVYGTSNFPNRFAGSFGPPRSVMGSVRVEF